MKKVIGMDLGDKQHVMVVFGEDGRELEASRCGNTSAQIQRWFGRYPEAVVAMEAGTHSAWISRLLQSMGHRVYVGHPRKLRTIWDRDDKSDERDARRLAMLCRVDPRMLYEIVHRSEAAQLDLEIIQARNVLVECRAKLINHVRGVAKGTGNRLPSCSSDCFVRRAQTHLPEGLKEPMQVVLDSIEALSLKIRAQDQRIAQISAERYPEAQALQQVPGVGPITSLAYVLTLEDPHRFAKSRTTGAFLGLTPRQNQSGNRDLQLGITHAGNSYMRKLLVGCAQYILGPFGPPSDLRRYGQRIAARGGKNAKKRAAVAVARKLAVLLHRLWMDQSVYVAEGFQPHKRVA